MFNLSAPKTLKLAVKTFSNAALRELNEISKLQVITNESSEAKLELLIQERKLKAASKHNSLVEANHDLLAELTADTKDYTAMQTAIDSYLKVK